MSASIATATSASATKKVTGFVDPNDPTRTVRDFNTGDKVWDPWVGLCGVVSKIGVAAEKEKDGHKYMDTKVVQVQFPDEVFKRYTREGLLFPGNPARNLYHQHEAQAIFTRPKETVISECSAIIGFMTVLSARVAQLFEKGEKVYLFDKASSAALKSLTEEQLDEIRDAWRGVLDKMTVAPAFAVAKEVADTMWIPMAILDPDTLTAPQKEALSSAGNNLDLIQAALAESFGTGLTTYLVGNVGVKGFKEALGKAVAKPEPTTEEDVENDEENTPAKIIRLPSDDVTVEKIAPVVAMPPTAMGSLGEKLAEAISNKPVTMSATATTDDEPVHKIMAEEEEVV